MAGSAAFDVILAPAAAGRRRRPARHVFKPGDRGWRRLRALVALTLLACACRPAPPGESGPPAVPWFEVRRDIDFVYQSGHQERHWFPEIMGGGACLFDFDNDGWLDLYLVQGGDLNRPDSDYRPPNRLLRNLRDGRFEEVTAAAGVAGSGYGMGCAVGDYDADGDVDLYVTNLGANLLYRNNGDGTFTDVTAVAGVGDASWSASAAMADYNLDGALDLFVVNYVQWSHQGDIPCAAMDGRAAYCSPSTYNAPAPDRLYRNRGDGRFEDVTTSAGVHRADGTGLGITCADFDGDGRLDFYVANDGMANQLWLNGPEGFSDRAIILGCAVNRYGVAEAGMGVVTCDVDQDGWPDLFMTHLAGETNTCYLNRGGFFEDSTAALNLGTPSLVYTAFGTGLADFDHDTNQDLYVANGRVTWQEPVLSAEDPHAEPNQLYRGRPGGFDEVLPRGGVAHQSLTTSRAAAFGDLDNDGDIDIVVVNRDAPAELLYNVATQGRSWIMFRVLDHWNRDAIGAAVTIRAGSLTRHRIVQTAYSYCAANDPRVHFGLDTFEQVDEVEVQWIGGPRERFGPFPARQVHELRQKELASK